MAEHELKTWPEPFQAVWDCDKVAEFRRDDRGFAAGDTLSLLEYDPEDSEYTGRRVVAEITHVLPGPSPHGIPEGYAMLSLRLLRGEEFGKLAWCN